MSQDGGYLPSRQVSKTIFIKAKARWVLRGFQDKQKDYLQTDSLASTRPGFRMSCQMEAKQGWNLFHLDLKTAFLTRTI